jgi:Outer membrane protein transport protein (OMPP1/FadL/TodX)
MLPHGGNAGRLKAGGAQLSLPVRFRPFLPGVFVLCLVSSATGQTPTPTVPPQIGQDELDLQARANVVQGSGARALGMGGAFLARADDATAASWNPAGLSYLRLPEVSFVYSGSRLDGLEVTAASRKDDRRHGHTPDFFAAAFPFELGRLSGSAQVSFQRTISFEGERTINETFFTNGQPTSTVPSVVTSAGGFDVIALGTGVAVGANVRIGATVNRWFNGYHQTLDRDTVRGGFPGHTTQEFDYDFSAWNLNLGLMWSPVPELNLGLVYKSAFTADVQLNKTRVDLTVPQSNNQASSRDTGPITLDFPAAVGLGASWRPRSRLTLSADYTRTFWSKGEIHNYFTLPVGRPGPGTPTIYPSLPYPSLALPPNQKQHDTVQVRGGVEFVFIFGRVKLPIRAGVFSDRQYVEASDGTPPHFTGLTAGTGIAVGPILLDVAFIRERGNYEAINTDGVTAAVSARARRLVGSMIYRFPRP